MGAIKGLDYYLRDGARDDDNRCVRYIINKRKTRVVVVDDRKSTRRD